jgi:glycerol-3-phosphate dehydrogenase
MNDAFSARKRGDVLRAMAGETFDLLVVGGGITGAGIALDAQTRGLRTALIEMNDFAFGTSSRSTKLVHGGLRYLKQFEVRMVAEVGRERAVVYENGPHVTVPENMLLPIYREGTLGRWMTSVGLMVYDRLAGVKPDERRRMLTAEETLEKLPYLKRNGLLGAGLYVEYRTDDARLTIEVIKKAVEEGARAVNHVKAERFLLENGKVTGVEATDMLTGRQYRIRAKRVVNAAGPWADSLRKLDGSLDGKTLRLTKGIHLVFDKSRFPLDHAVYFDHSDGRMIFAIPRGRKTYVGTTDTDYDGDIAHPRMTKEDQAYLLAAVNGMFPGLWLTEADIETGWAGLRPLIAEEGKSPSEVSRRDEVFVSDSGLITIAGGKLTGYRKMAETVVDRVARQLAKEGMRTAPCRTKHLPVSGGDVGGSAGFPSFVERKAREGVKLGLTATEAEALARFYGSNVDRLFRLAEELRQEADGEQMPLSVLMRLAYAVEEECAATPTDFFLRRTGWMLFDLPAVMRYKDAVIESMARRLDWTEDEKRRHAADLQQAVEEATVALGRESAP